MAYFARLTGLISLVGVLAARYGMLATDRSQEMADRRDMCIVMMIRKSLVSYFWRRS